MTAMTLPRARRGQSLLGKVIESLGRSAKARRRVAVVASAVRDNVTTVAAFAACDYGVYQLSHAAAWITAAPLLMLLEWKARGD
jgi:hypothetical protein